MRTSIKVFLSIFTLSLLSWFCVFLYSVLTNPLIPLDKKPVVLIINKKTSASELAQTLKEEQLISSKFIFLAPVHFKRITHRLKAGIYEVNPGESILQLINKIVSGDCLIEAFTIVEGTTLEQIKTKLLQAPYLLYQDKMWANIKTDYPSQEGLLLADTYHYKAGSDAKHLLELAHQSLLETLNYYWQNRTPGLPYQSAYQLLIAASIIEKETALESEKKLIAGVLINRLKLKMPLQMDPTVIYGLGSRYLGKLSHEDMSFDSLYNTYRHRGLPPTPIAMVGKKSLEAAAQPELTEYLYFVSRGNGSHHFSTNYEEQKKAILRYQGKKSQ